MRRGIGAAFVLTFVLGASAAAQQPDPAASIESLRLALQRPERPSILLPDMSWVDRGPVRFGILTLLQPDLRGQFVKVAVPVGDLLSRASNAISTARHRRAERKARERVSRELQRVGR